MKARHLDNQYHDWNHFKDWTLVPARIITQIDSQPGKPSL
jgi:hypothetical protein